MENEFNLKDKERTSIDSESLKVIRNSKGYNWEIKMFPKDDEENMYDRLVDRITIIDNQMRERFGGEK